MATRTVYLPAIDRTVSLKAYVNAIKTAKANLNVEFKQGLTCWWPVTGAEIMQQFRRGMNERISEGVPYIERDSKY